MSGASNARYWASKAEASLTSFQKPKASSQSDWSTNHDSCQPSAEQSALLTVGGKRPVYSAGILLNRETPAAKRHRERKEELRRLDAARAAATDAILASMPVDPSAPLPPGWDVKEDTATGYKWYVNVLSGASQWERPTKPATVHIPRGWKAAKDPATGKVYYANPSTGQTQWTPPTGEEAAAAAAAASGPAVDPKPGQLLGPSTVRVTGIPHEMTDQDLISLIRGVGSRVLRAEMDRRWNVDGSTRFAGATKAATVRFQTPADAEHAVQKMNGVMMRRKKGGDLPGAKLQLVRTDDIPQDDYEIKKHEIDLKSLWR